MRTLAPFLALLGCQSPPCHRHGDCRETELCAREQADRPHRCVDALGQRYRVEVLETEMDPLDPDGQPWDPVGPGEAPDPRVRFGVVGRQMCATEVAPDSLFVDWNEVCEFELRSGDTFELALLDDDAPDEPRIAWAWPAGTDAELVELARDSGEAHWLYDPWDTVRVWYRLDLLDLEAVR